MVSQYFGAKDRESLSWTIGNCILLTLIASLIMTVVGVVIARPLLAALRTPATIIDWCTSYLRILFIGSLGCGYYNILSGVLRGLGDSVSALIYLVVASVLNIVLDIFFVVGLHMGVDGVAWATIIAQGISAVLCVLRLAKMSEHFDFGLAFCRWRQEFAGKIIHLGLPSGVTQAIMSVSIVIVQSLTNSFGEMMIAANVIVMRVDGFAMQPNFSFGMAMTTYAGQNIGAGEKERVIRGSRQGLIMAVLFSAAITTAILLFGRPLMGVFTKTEALVDLSMHLMRILAVGYVVMAVIQCLQGVMRGAGDTVTPMWLSIVQTLVFRMPLAYLMVGLTRTAENPLGNRDMLFWSLLTAWVLGAILTVIFYRRGRWKEKGVVQH